MPTHPCIYHNYVPIVKEQVKSITLPQGNLEYDPDELMTECFFK